MREPRALVFIACFALALLFPAEPVFGGDRSNPGPATVERSREPQPGAAREPRSRAPAGTGSISGNVSALGFIPVVGAQVEIFDSDGEYVGSAFTDGTGSYTYGGLGTYDYIVYFYTRNAGYANSYYADVTSVLDATLVHVVDGAVTTGINASPQLGGIVAGTVTNGGGPVANVTVSLYDHEMSFIDEVLTNGAGYYQFIGLNKGTYALEFQAQDQGYIPEFYSDRDSLAHADPVTLGTVATVDAVLSPGGSMAGQVTGPSATPVAAARVSAYDSQGRKRGDDLTDGAGNFLIPGLPSGDYVVQYEADGFLDEYNGDGEWGCLDRIAVNAPQAVTGVNARLASGGTISGTVTDGGAPLAGIVVTAMPGGYSYGPTAVTDALGRYEINGLVSRGHRVFFNGGSAGLASEYYDNKPGRSAADVIEVTAPDHVTGVDAVLSPGGAISGIVRDGGGNPINHAFVSVRDENFQQFGTAYTDAAGAYRVENLASSRFYVTASATGDGMLSEYYRESPDRAGARLVTVTAPNETAAINFTLVPGGVISGRVTAGGYPVSGLWVNAEDIGGDRGNSASTNLLGRYRIANLQSGRYHVNFYGPDMGYRDEHYDNQPLYSKSALVSVAAPGETTGIDAAMEPFSGGTFSGTMSWPDGACGGGNSWVDIFPKNALSDYDLPGWGNVGPFGTYVSTVLPPGKYYPQFGWYHDEVESKFWRGATEPCHLFAKPVEVRANENTAGIDVDFGRLLDRTRKFPAPAIFADDWFRGIEIGRGDPVTLTFSLDCNAAEGMALDHWLLALTPLPPPHQYYSFDPPGGWTRGMMPGREDACRSFEKRKLTLKGLPKGRTTLAFGVDPRDGELDIPRFFVGCVDVIVR